MDFTIWNPTSTECKARMHYQAPFAKFDSRALCKQARKSANERQGEKGKDREPENYFKPAAGAIIEIGEKTMPQFARFVSRNEPKHPVDDHKTACRCNHYSSSYGFQISRTGKMERSIAQICKALP